MSSPMCRLDLPFVRTYEKCKTVSGTLKSPNVRPPEDRCTNKIANNLTKNFAVSSDEAL
jgi:hypothetical protein